MKEKMRIIIVEDEYYVRKGIIDALDWAEYGCEIVGEADNGARGLEAAKALQPHLVIADIDMPMKNGIDMVKELKTLGLNAEYIFLTSHQNFNYVYNAIKLDVIDYLLKPFRTEDLIQCLQKVRVKLHMTDPEENRMLRIFEKDLHVKNVLVKEAVQYTRRHYGEDISSQIVAESLSISPAYFCRIFKKETGYTFSQYLANYRVHIAAGMLVNFDVRVSEVAAQVGIDDSNYFSQIFKKITGMTPTEYQDSQRYF